MQYDASNFLDPFSTGLPLGYRHVTPHRRDTPPGGLPITKQDKDGVAQGKLFPVMIKQINSLLAAYEFGLLTQPNRTIDKR